MHEIDAFEKFHLPLSPEIGLNRRAVDVLLLPVEDASDRRGTTQRAHLRYVNIDHSSQKKRHQDDEVVPLLVLVLHCHWEYHVLEGVH